MPNRLSAGCCCGCGIYTFDDVLTASSGTSIIDGFTVINKSLSANGLWSIFIQPKVTGTIDDTSDVFEFRLLRPDNSVFAEWSLGVYQELSPTEALDLSTVNVLRRVNRLTMDWNGNTIQDHMQTRLVGFTSLPVTNLVVYQHEIVGRKECSSMFAPIADNLYAYRGGERGSQYVPDISLGTAQQTIDVEYSGSITGFSDGFPLANDEAEFLAAGPFRLACKFNKSPSTNTATIRAVATRIYQEEPEKNATCEIRTICPVTYPHYTTPMWEVESITGDCTFNTTESGNGYGADCISELWHHHIERVTSATFAYNTTQRTDPQVGWLYSNGSEVMKPFAYDGLTYDDIADSPLVWEFTGGSEIDSANYIQGSPLAFREAAFPFFIDLQLVATDDPATWRILLTLSILAWSRYHRSDSKSPASLSYIGNVYSNGFDSTSDGFGSLRRVTIAGTQYVILANPQAEARLPTSNAYRTDFLRYNVHSVGYVKDVPAWTNEPPEVSFSSDDRIDDDTPTLHFLRELSSGPLTFIGSLGQASAPINFDWLAVNKDSINFTLRPRATPRVPHP